MLKRGLPFAVLALVLLVGYGLALAADAPKAFNLCKACHKVEAGKNGVGPSLAGVLGRKAGVAEGFKYSEVMKSSGKTWDAATLSTFLADPKATVPGSKMAHPGVKNPDDVKALVDYLGTLK